MVARVVRVASVVATPSRMGMLSAKEAMSKVHTTITDGKSTHDAHEDDSETCGAPLDAGACFCSNLLDFVSLHVSNCIKHSC